MKKLTLPTTILLGCFILGFFYLYVEKTKQMSAERQTQMNIEQENYIKQLEQEKEIKQTQINIEQENYIKQLEQDAKDKEDAELKAKQESEASIKKKCSVYLERNGNYLVTNETLLTNYNSCLHANGL